MKKSVLGIAAILTLSAGSVMAGSKHQSLDPYVEGQLVKICKAAADNKSSQVRQLLRKNRISYRSAANDIVCNGQSLISFAALNGGEDAAVFIAKRAKVKIDGLLAMNRN